MFMPTSTPASMPASRAAGPASAVALVTGSTNGIGHGVARRLLAAGMTVIVHGPTPEHVEGARDRLILAGLPVERAEFEVADFRDLHAVAELAERVAARHPRLDVLVNNAAVAGSDTRAVTDDGHEVTHQVNYLAPYLLTRLLWEPLCARQGRVVSVSSVLHRTGNFNWGDMDRTKHYSRTAAYAQSKLQLTMFTRAAAAVAGDRLLAVSVHPGVVAAGLLPLYARTGAPVGEAVEAVAQLCLPGSDPVNGAYYDGRVQAPVAPLAKEERAVARLWKATAKAVGLDRAPAVVGA
jgi:NAD(P)-dependent dehydrogenase (short-subunit alcohol dehydrogenase family)